MRRELATVHAAMTLALGFCCQTAYGQAATQAVDAKNAAPPGVPAIAAVSDSDAPPASATSDVDVAAGGPAPSASAEATPVLQARPSEPKVPTCEPTCRAGFGCVAGQCRSLCNPPCGDAFECTADARCSFRRPYTSEDLTQIIAMYQRGLERASRYRHDGFYARLGVNGGYVFAAADGTNLKSISGFGTFLDLAVGGTLSRGLVLAFAIHGVSVFEPKAKWNSNDAPSTSEAESALPADDDEPLIGGYDAFFVDAPGKVEAASFAVLGARADYYPDDREGLHFSGTVGWGVADVVRENNTESDLGLGLSLGVGYDFWIGEQWSLGFEARALYVNGAKDESGTYQVIIPAYTVGVVYH